MKLITVDDVLALRPCSNYTREVLLDLWAGREAINAAEYAELPVPPLDRRWGMDRLWPEAIPRSTELTVTRCITNHALNCGIESVEAWARKWLSVEDGSREALAAHEASSAARSAWSAAHEASSAPRAARAAARAAWSAAWSAARAARAAWSAAWSAAWAAEAAERELQIQDMLTAINELEATR